ncbi:hypothetical protein [Dyadobacter chenhuakuii]|uniref:DUF4369 domain-containing protein n=1 Tax=Dyadobacter chenhuakuii TaxID=2909339 RepID=A0ABY4XMW7_9BACT|nr:hypothetical protein [Dyadobacter chenhuakuii]MCF2494962.1 hypothetical protein [Dyadobacter chenhuakuii]USJ31723.1 hypothetical protein NFI80_03075 [Dyadobacter chenhuakuii]
MGMRFIGLAIIFSGFFTFSSASTDSLIVKGRILNLNGRLYRQAPVITFSRNNILQPQSELSKQTPLEADGSFRVSLPILFPQEEFYLDYGGKAFTTFLGSPGTVEITFDGDSIAKASKLFYFAGVNADANNQYAQYLAAENKLLAANSYLGANFFKNFWQNSASGAREIAQQRAALRLSAVKQAAANTVPSPTLSQWAKSITDEEQLQILYEHALSNQTDVSKLLLDSLKRLSEPPLTAQRVIWANRFGNYADLKVEERKYTNPSKTNSLPVRLMATLIKDNAANLTPTERQRLNDINANGLAEKTDLDFLNKLFAKNETVLNILFNYERESRIYADLFDSTATEFLKIRYLAKNLFKFTYPQQLQLNRHIQSRSGLPVFRESLDEIVRLEVKDSADIRKIVEYKNVKTDPTEALPGYFLAASNDRGTSWFNRVLDQYKGKTVYLVKWNMDDAKSREELDYIPALQANVPEDVVFLFLHLSGDEVVPADALLRQYIVRHKLKGTHLFMDTNQMMDLLFRLNPLDPGTFSLIRPNGKFASRNASAPSATDKTIKAILDAGK